MSQIDKYLFKNYDIYKLCLFNTITSFSTLTNLNLKECL
jgi:hypothetical protein